MNAFDPDVIFDALNRHHVEYVVIGGIATTILGGDCVNGDLDICHRRSGQNLAALALAVQHLDADPAAVSDSDTFSVKTYAGSLDCHATPAGTKGYEDLIESSWRFDLAGREMRVSSVDALIRMKTAANRSIDRIDLEELHSLKQLIESGGDSS